MKILKKNIPIKSKLFDAHVLLTAILLRFGFASIFTDIVSGFRVSSERGSLYTISGEKIQGKDMSMTLKSSYWGKTIKLNILKKPKTLI